MQHVRHIIRLVHQLMRIGRETGREIPLADLLPVDVQLVDAHCRGVQLRLRDFAPKRQIIGHPAIRREESAIGKDDFPAAQKFITEQRLIDICAIKPYGRV